MTVTNIKSLLEKAEITLDQLVDIINQEGGRDLNTPILFSEQCQGCGCRFFSISQDHFLRIKNGYPTHCSSCRIIERRRTKLNSYHKNKKF